MKPHCINLNTFQQFSNNKLFQWEVSTVTIVSIIHKPRVGYNPIFLWSEVNANRKCDSWPVKQADQQSAKCHMSTEALTTRQRYRPAEAVG